MIRKIGLAAPLLATAALGACTNVAGVQRVERDQARVEVADLDLDTAAGRRELEERISYAAYAVCDYSPGSPLERYRHKKCQSATSEETLQRIALH